jgi:hypothetical protein
MAQFVYPAQSVSIPGVATEATLLQVEANTADTVQELQDVNSELNTQSASLASIDAKLTAPVAVDGPLTDAELRATPVPVSGPLTDVQLRATPVDVAGPLTDAELRATAVPVSGPLTDAELRASAVPVSAASLPLPTGAATEATLSAVQSAVDNLDARVAGSLVPEEFDYQDISYVGAGNGAGEVFQVVYKLGGSGGTTVATLTLAYDSSNRVTSVTRS